MWDSGGKTADGVLTGNWALTGLPCSCYEVENDAFSVKYCAVRIFKRAVDNDDYDNDDDEGPVNGLVGPPNSLVGICLPNECDVEDFLTGQNRRRRSLTRVNDDDDDNNRTLSIHLEYCKSPSDTVQFTAGFWIYW